MTQREGSGGSHRRSDPQTQHGVHGGSSPASGFAVIAALLFELVIGDLSKVTR